MGALWDAGKVDGFEMLTRRKDGSTFWSSVTAIPRRTEAGEQQVVAVIQDITERKKAADRIASQAPLSVT